MSRSDQLQAAKPVSTWRKVLAAVLDFIFVFAIAGYAIASMTGDVGEDGFELKGGPAFLCSRSSSYIL